MTFTEELTLKIVESGIIALVLLLIGHWLNRNLTSLKTAQSKVLELEKQNLSLQSTLAQDKRSRKLEKINAQLAEFYFPIYYRLQKDDAMWRLSPRLNTADQTLPPEASDIIEYDYLLPNHQEILDIIESKSHLIDLDEAFQEEIRKYIRHVAVYATIRKVDSLKSYNPDYFKAVYPPAFKAMVEAKIVQLQKEYEGIFQKLTLESP